MRGTISAADFWRRRRVDTFPPGLDRDEEPLSPNWKLPQPVVGLLIRL